jgi:hypothetical protein
MNGTCSCGSPERHRLVPTKEVLMTDDGVLPDELMSQMGFFKKRSNVGPDRGGCIQALGIEVSLCVAADWR